VVQEAAHYFWLSQQQGGRSWLARMPLLLGSLLSRSAYTTWLAGVCVPLALVLPFDQLVA